MKGNFDQCFKITLVYEGGFVNHPKDPGGMTNLGVTKSVWQNYLNRDVTEAEMRALTPEIVKPLYKKRYWDAVRGDDLPSGLDAVVYDFAVNSGPARAAKFLQRIVGAAEDGKIGPGTLKLVGEHNANDLIEKMCEARLNFLKGLSTFATFGKGWTDRVAKLEAVAEKLSTV